MRYQPSLLLIVALLVAVSGVAAQDATTFTVRIENVSAFPLADVVTDSGVFAVPNGAEEAGPATPGQFYTFDITANPGDVLTFATMWAQSNDAFYSPDEAGIALYDAEGNPISGDVSDQVLLWDLGTEVNEEPGVGVNQAPRQEAPNTGEVENGVVLPISDVADGYTYADIIGVTVESTGENAFTVTITNTSPEDLGGYPGVLSPGAYIVHSGDASGALFTQGERDYGYGLEQIAEDGPPARLGATLSGMLATPITPGVFVTFDPAANPNPLFELGTPDYGMGLEAIAEDGMPTTLAESVDGQFSSTGVFSEPMGDDMMTEEMMPMPGPAFPGLHYEFSIEAVPGEALTFATMYVQTNDIIFAPDGMGIALFDAEGNPINGDVTDQLLVIDAGTEVNEPIGEGATQAPRQEAPDTGADENGNVVVYEADDFTATAQDFIRVVITPEGAM